MKKELIGQQNQSDVIKQLESAGWGRRSEDKDKKEVTYGGRNYKVVGTFEKKYSNKERALRALKGIGLTVLTLGYALKERKVQKLFTANAEKKRVIDEVKSEGEENNSTQSSWSRAEDTVNDFIKSSPDKYAQVNAEESKESVLKMLSAVYSSKGEVSKENDPDNYYKIQNATRVLLFNPGKIRKEKIKINANNFLNMTDLTREKLINESEVEIDRLRAEMSKAKETLLNYIPKEQKTTLIERLFFSSEVGKGLLKNENLGRKD